MADRSEAVGWSRSEHDPKTCRVYGCLMCRAAKEGVGEGIQKKKERMNRPIEVKKLSWEEYAELTASEQLLAMREGRAPGR